MPRVLNIILSHQPPDGVRRVLDYWKPVVRDSELLLAFGGTRENFDGAGYEPRIFVEGPRLRTRDQQRDFQSMIGVYGGVTRWLRASGSQAEFVYFAEFDHLPLVANLNEKQMDRLAAEKADGLAVNLQRIDGTSHAHYLYHIANPGFRTWLHSISIRDDKEVVLSMLGTGSFWSREAFEAIGDAEEMVPVYNELFVPTLAHHLGFRVRDWDDQTHFARNLGDFGDQMESWRDAGAWTIHPVKTLPTRLPPLQNA